MQTELPFKDDAPKGKRTRESYNKRKPEVKVNRRPYIDKFRQITGITPKFDGLLSALSGELFVDILDLDEKIERACKKPYDRKKGIYDGKPNHSMQDVVEAEWGKEAKELLKLI